MGHLWAQLLHQSRVPRNGTVMEIGPGFSTKIGLGLAETGFHGRIVLVEPNHSARRSAQQEYRRLLPAAEVAAWAAPVPELGRLPTGPVDLLAANHILDDLLFNSCVRAEVAADVFAGMRPGSECSDQFIRTWRQIADSPGALDRMVDRVVDDLTLYLARVRPARLLVSEYPSWRHDRCGLGFIHEVSIDVMRRMESALMSDESCAAHTYQVGASMSWLISPTYGNR